MSIGQPTDRFALEHGGIIPQLKRLQLPSTIQFDLKPTWGVSALRSKTATNGTGATVAETGGEIEVASGTDGAGSASLTTIRRGQYRSGTWGEASLGVRLGSTPTGDQVARWGYFDDQNGWGWGADSEGFFLFRRKDGTDTVRRPAEWEGDPLNGDGDSSITLDVTDGAVYHNLFRWYGHGPAVWYVEPKRPNAQWTPEVKADWQVYRGEISVTDPNQPVNVEVDNNGTAENLSVYVGGRQFAIWGRREKSAVRNVPLVERAFSISSADTWEPILALQKKSTFGPSGRDNTVKTLVKRIGALASGANVEIRLTLDAETDATYKDPEGWTGSETSIERSDGAFSVTTDGEPIVHGMVASGSSKNAAGTTKRNARIPLAENQEAVLWGRSASTPSIPVSKVMVEEQR